MIMNKDIEVKSQKNTLANMGTILVAVDFSEVTPQVYEVASHLAERLQARVTVLNISEPHGDYIAYQPAPLDGYQDASIEAHATQKLLEAKAFFNAHGLAVDTLHHWGPAVERILDEAKLRAAGLIVIGSHGHGPLYNPPVPLKIEIHAEARSGGEAEVRDGTALSTGICISPRLRASA